MPRPCKCRTIGHCPPVQVFLPAGMEAPTPDDIVLRPDEFEAFRLAGLEELYHEEAAARMSISRQTFGNLLKAAQRKIASALVHGKPLRLAPVEAASGGPGAVCPRCLHWQTPAVAGKACTCPHCRRQDHPRRNPT